MLTVLLTALVALGPVAAQPRGRYEARVWLPPLPAQRVAVVAHGGPRATLYLQGVVNTPPETPFHLSFRREPDGTMAVGAAAEFHEMLRAHRCSLQSVVYDGTEDALTVTLALPLLGHRRIRLRRAAEHG